LNIVNRAIDRRTAVKYLAASPLIASGFCAVQRSCGADLAGGRFRLSTFATDVTPPLGSPLCGGWITSAQAVDDPLQARGVVLIGSDKPIVLCAIDWVENNNATYDAWRGAIAAAAGTDASHVAVHCVHPHNTPWADVDADKAIQAIDDKLELVNSEFVDVAIKRTAAAVKKSLEQLQPITHVGVGEGEVKEVASNRRILGPDGKIASMRMSKCKDAALREAPEGLIDPRLKTVSFWNEDKPIAALHYYATHPMSYYGDGRVTTDFCGLARDKRQREQPDVFQIYFTGCAGDIAAGKYNDGSHEMRPILRDRVHAGMVAAWKATKRSPISKLEWSVADAKFAPRTEEAFSLEQIKKLVANPNAKPQRRLIAAVIQSWLDRIDKPVELSSLRTGGTTILHLPGEPFIDYQLFAQSQRPEGFVCVAGYGDGGCGYIPLQDSYAQGGYEPTMAFVEPDSELLLKDRIRRLLAAGAT
jgi:hypothetical protein